MTSLEVRDMKYLYDKHIVLDGVDLKIKEGEILGILGPNGCGKTTLLRNLNKNLSPKGGCILLNDMAMKAIQKKDVTSFRWEGCPSRA